MNFCDECGEPLGDSVRRSAWSGRFFCDDCRTANDELEPARDLEDRLDRAMRVSTHPTSVAHEDKEKR